MILETFVACRGSGGIKIVFHERSERFALRLGHVGDS